MQIKIALIGAGMFGGDVHAQAYAELQRSGISPHLARIGLSDWARDLAPIRFELAAVATRTEASARAFARKYQSWTGAEPRCWWGETSWKPLCEAMPEVDVIAVATPDHLHTPVIVDALEAGKDVLAEKPLCLDIHEADQILERARAKNRIVALDMHKRYDPDHLRIRDELVSKIGAPLYGLAYLEEPLEVAAGTFKWVEQSDPFSYVGSHWVDLIQHYFGSKPVSLTAVGQKQLLLSRHINAYDAVQVRVDYQNGMSISYHNNWITPPDFEGPVNQGHELVGALGKIESDQQYRGLRWWRHGTGSRTLNTHFTREVNQARSPTGFTGYGMDSIVASLAAVCRARFFQTPRQELASLYPTAEEARITVAILHAARVVRDRNFQYLQKGQGAAVTARFGPDGITIVDPNRAIETAASAFEHIYQKPI